MTGEYRTQQEDFWAGEFGDDYTKRNQSAETIASNTALFSRVLPRMKRIESVIELGANIGMNLRALQFLLPKAALAGVEINEAAAKELSQIERIRVFNDSILDFRPEEQWDLSLIKGVLIHIDPDQLPRVYDLLYAASRRYICIVEYYSPHPQALDYRGHQDRLFKRDFAGEVLDRFKDLTLLDYGFVYHRDPFPQDDINWFLLEKAVEA